MPIFGEYETLGEPVAISEERGHVSTVWQARKTGGDNRLYAVKCYAPRARQPKPGEEGELDKDRGIEFLEAIKQLKKAQSEGGRCLCAVHALGIAPEGAWYVTDFYPGRTLREWISKRGRVDSDAIKQVVYSCAVGCLALKRSRGYSHGNLKATNVFLVGTPRPLRKRPLHLGDPYPASTAQMANLDAEDRRAVTDLLAQTAALQDLRAIGELILQLVEGRLVANAYDYNYPIERSRHWDNLGKDGETWRELCNLLLDPHLAPEKISLEALEQRFGPNVMLARLPLVAGAAALLILVVVSLIFGVSRFRHAQYAKHFKAARELENRDLDGAQKEAIAALKWRGSSEEAKTLLADLNRRISDRNSGEIAIKEKAEKEMADAWVADMKMGANSLNESKFQDALAAFTAATQRKGKYIDSDKQRQAEQGSALADALQNAKANLDTEPAKARTFLEKASQAARLYNNDVAVRWATVAALERSNVRLSANDWVEADQWLQIAVSFSPQNADAKNLREKIDALKVKPDTDWQTLTKAKGFAEMAARWREMGFEKEITNLLRRDFLSNYQASPSIDLAAREKDLKLTDFEQPTIWPKLSASDRTKETQAVQLLGKNNLTRERLGEWRKDVDRRYAPIPIQELANNWTGSRDEMIKKIDDLDSYAKSPTNSPAIIKSLNDDLQELKKLTNSIAEIEIDARKGGQLQESIKTQAMLVVSETWPALKGKINQHIESLSADAATRKFRTTYPWFSDSLKTSLEKERQADKSLAAVFQGLPDYPDSADKRTAAERPLGKFKGDLAAWWTNSVPNGQDFKDLPGNKILDSAFAGLTNARSPDFSSDAKLIAGIADRFRAAEEIRSATAFLKQEWSGLANCARSIKGWTEAATEYRVVPEQLLRRDLEEKLTNAATIIALTNSLSTNASVLLSACNNGDYDPPEVLGKLKSEESKKTELAALLAIVQAKTNRTYKQWRADLTSNYSPVEVKTLLDSWGILTTNTLYRALADLEETFTNGSAVDYDIKTNQFPKKFDDLFQRKTDLETKARSGGWNHEALRTEGGQVLTDYKALLAAVPAEQTRIAGLRQARETRVWSDADAAFKGGDYAKVAELTKGRTNDARFNTLAVNSQAESNRWSGFIARTNGASKDNKEWVKLRDDLKKEKPETLAKDRFAALNQWVNQKEKDEQSLRQAQQAMLDGQLADLMVILNVSPPSWLKKLAKEKKPYASDSMPDDTKTYYSNRVDLLENAYKMNGLLTIDKRQEYLNSVRKSINVW